MQKSKLKVLLVLPLAALFLLQSGLVFGAASATVSTLSIADLQNTSALLGGDVQNVETSSPASVWFQWGTDTNYGSETERQTMDQPGNFSKAVSGLQPGTEYHYRAVVEDNTGISYGQDVPFTTEGTQASSLGSGMLTVGKNVINLTSGNLSWQNNITANPGDILAFAITIQAGSQDVHNVVVKDALSSNLIYKGNLTINAQLNSTENPTSSTGINVGTIPANGIEIISYQAQVAPATSFVSPSTLTNSAIINSTEAGAQNVYATVSVNYPPTSASSNPAGPTEIPTGLTNNIFTDSFFLPLLLIVLGSWMWFSFPNFKNKIRELLRIRA